MSEHRNALQSGYRLHWYVIKEVLGQGGFGITYLAQDTNLDHAVAIKEYLPVEMAVRAGDAGVHPVSGEHGEPFRWGLDRFISEAQTLARFKHPNIVRVFTVFSANNTGYMVMEYERGQGLHEILKQRRTLPEAELLMLLGPILDGLEQVHDRGFIHRDIKPANLFVRADGSPVLLDFGSARQSFGEKTRTLTAMVSPGFAPFEQYTGKGDKQGPWTDIYGLGATLYRSVIGRSPANAMDRSESLLQASRDIYVRAAEIDPPGYSRNLLAAIDRALAFRAEDRPQSIANWRRELARPALGIRPDTAVPTLIADDADITPVAARRDGDTLKISIEAGSGAPVDGSVPAGRARRRGWHFWTALAAVPLVIALGFLAGRRTPPESVTTSSPVATRPAPAARSDALPEIGLQSSADSSHAPAAETSALAAQAVPSGGRSATTADPSASPAAPGEAPAISAPPAGSEWDTPPSPAAPGFEPLISPRERVQLAALRRRLQQNPGDREARQQLRGMGNEFERVVKQAVKEGDYDRAEAYVNELLRLAPDNEGFKEALRMIARERRGRL